jgi:hypothetical protein
MAGEELAERYQLASLSPLRYALRASTRPEAVSPLPAARFGVDDQRVVTGERPPTTGLRRDEGGEGTEGKATGATPREGTRPTTEGGTVGGRRPPLQRGEAGRGTGQRRMV